jgi:hypothetical protein
MDNLQGKNQLAWYTGSSGSSCGSRNTVHNLKNRPDGTEDFKAGKTPVPKIVFILLFPRIKTLALQYSVDRTRISAAVKDGKPRVSSRFLVEVGFGYNTAALPHLSQFAGSGVVAKGYEGYMPRKWAELEK